MELHWSGFSGSRLDSCCHFVSATAGFVSEHVWYGKAYCIVCSLILRVYILHSQAFVQSRRLREAVQNCAVLRVGIILQYTLYIHIACIGCIGLNLNPVIPGVPIDEA